MRPPLHSLLLVALSVAADPVPPANDACAVSVHLESPDNFYPPGPIRRDEEGKAVIEFTAEPGVQHARDIEVVKSSGVPDLDKAALKIGAALRVASACSERRARFVIEFIHDHERKQLGIDSFRVEVSVVISPADPAN